MEVKAKLKNVRISAKKVRLVALAVKGLPATEAQDRLAVLSKRSAPILIKLLKSAVANAVDRYDVKPDDLIIKTITANKGQELKRWQPAAFGSAHPYVKHAAHIEVVLTVKEGAKVTARDKKAAAIDTVDLSKAKKDQKKNQEAEDKDNKDKGVKSGDGDKGSKKVINKVVNRRKNVQPIKTGQ